VVIGSPVHGISNADDCQWVIIDGFEVLGARYDGIKLNGDHNVVQGPHGLTVDPDRAAWYAVWPYRFSPSPEHDAPDLWVAPPATP